MRFFEELGDYLLRGRGVLAARNFCGILHNDYPQEFTIGLMHYQQFAEDPGKYKETTCRFGKKVSPLDFLTMSLKKIHLISIFGLFNFDHFIRVLREYPKSPATLDQPNAVG